MSSLHICVDFARIIFDRSKDLQLVVVTCTIVTFTYIEKLGDSEADVNINDKMPSLFFRYPCFIICA